MATHSNILAWEISWTEEPGRLQATVHEVPKELDTTEELMLLTFSKSWTSTSQEEIHKVNEHINEHNGQPY